MTTITQAKKQLRLEQFTIKDLFSIRDALEILRDYGLCDEYLYEEVMEDIKELEDK